MNAEEFYRFWSKKPDTPEGRLAEAYRKAKADFELQQSALLQYIRIEKKGDQLIPVFSPEAAAFAGLHWDAEKRVLDIKRDTEAFLGITEGESSILPLAEKLARARRNVSDAERDARIALEKAIRKGAGSVDEAEQSPDVQTAFDRRDRLKSEMQPIISNLENRLAKAKAILEKTDK